MIRITMEMLPGGDENHPRRRTLGHVDLVNDGIVTVPSRGNYRATMYDARGRVRFTSTVINFPRRRLGIYDLLYRALREVVATRNPWETP